MNIFNSLGSNYDFKFALSALFAGNDQRKTELLTKYLDTKYQGQTTLVYKGREALKLALKLANLPVGSFVAINGYTCYVVYQAVTEAGFKPDYLDISESRFNFSAETLKLALEKNPLIKAVVIQNTLGTPCEIQEIKALCQEKNLVLIEDLAHSVGAKYANGQEAGTVGDFVALSFSQDKMIDAVSGGALVVRNKKYISAQALNKIKVNFIQQLRDRFYPILTFKYRKTYPIGLGKLMHKIDRTLNLLPTPMGANSQIEFHELPSWYCGLVLEKFQKLENNLNHRKEIAHAYSKILKINSETISNSSNLRFPVLVKSRAGLIAFLKQSGIYVSDIWYDAPIAPLSYMKLVEYDHQCPQSERISERMLNLPTHQNVSVDQAKQIANRVNQWLLK